MDLVIGLLVACADPSKPPDDGDGDDTVASCTSFDDMTVTDPDGLMDPSDVPKAEATIAHFAEWTGRDGVCVPGITFVADTEGAPDYGTYHGRYEPITIGSSQGGASAGWPLCYALGRELGWSADALWDSRQEFVFACMDGPDGLELAQHVEDACGVSIVGADDRYLRDEVFGGWAEPDVTLAEGAEVTLGSPVVAAVSLDDVIAVAGSGTRVHALTSTRDAPWTLHTFDAASGTEVATLALASTDGDWWSLLSGDTGLLLVHLPSSSDDAPTAWWVADDATALVSVPLDRISTWSGLRGFVRGGTAYFSTLPLGDTSHYPAWMHADLTTGTVVTDSASDTTRYAWSAFDDGDHLVAERGDVYSLHTADVAFLDPNSGSVASTLSVPWRLGSPVPLGDGRVLAEWHSPGERSRQRLFLVGDPAASTWTLATPTCEARDTRWSDRWVQVGGRPVLLEEAEGGMAIRTVEVR